MKSKVVHYDYSGFGESLCGYSAGNPKVKWTILKSKTTCKKCKKKMGGK